VEGNAELPCSISELIQPGLWPHRDADDGILLVCVAEAGHLCRLALALCSRSAER